jgi:hypothetical protein
LFYNCFKNWYDRCAYIKWKKTAYNFSVFLLINISYPTFWLTWSERVSWNKCSRFFYAQARQTELSL